MTIHTCSKNRFELLNEKDQVVASIIYSGNTFDKAVLKTDEEFLLETVAAGTWVTHVQNGPRKKLIARLKVAAGGIISVKLENRKQRYLFRKPMGWRLRFALVNKEGDDVLTIIPNVNWRKESHDHILQLNEELESECDSFLILQAVHCANCSLSMMTGGPVPALISM